MDFTLEYLLDQVYSTTDTEVKTLSNTDYAIYMTWIDGCLRTFSVVRKTNA
jgi:hypothetical protein